MEFKINNNKKPRNRLHPRLRASLEEKMQGRQGDWAPKPGRHSCLSLTYTRASHTHTHTHTDTRASHTHTHGLHTHTHTGFSHTHRHTHTAASQVTRMHVHTHTPPSGGTRGKAPACECRREQMQAGSLGRKVPWRRAWQPTLEFLTGESHGQRSLVGYSPWGHKELDTTEVT